MAPEHIVVRFIVAPAVGSTQQSQPSRPESPKEIVERLLADLSRQKSTLRCRCIQTLDPEPETLDQTCLSCLVQARWRKRVEAFFRRIYPEALVFAEAILKDRFEAEEVVSETFIELLEGNTEPKFFFRALKLNALNRLERLCPEAFDEAGWEEEFALAADEDSDEAVGMLEIADGTQDPVEVLISRREYLQIHRLIFRARLIAETDKKYRWIKRKEWAKPLNLGRKSGTEMAWSPE